MHYHTIAIDCDDVLVGTAPALIIKHYNKTYGTSLELKDVYKDNLERLGVPDLATAIARIEAYLETAEYRKAPPFREAIRSHQTTQLPL